MPQYATTVLFIFVLASCFYKKHVQDWRLFRLGVYLFLGSIAIIVLNRVMPGSAGFMMLSGGTGNSWVSKIFGLLAALSELAAFGVMVLACLRTAELDAGLRCPSCSYTLKGLSEPRCPECGYQI